MNSLCLFVASSLGCVIMTSWPVVAMICTFHFSLRGLAAKGSDDENDWGAVNVSLRNRSAFRSIRSRWVDLRKCYMGAGRGQTLLDPFRHHSNNS